MVGVASEQQKETTFDVGTDWASGPSDLTFNILQLTTWPLPSIHVLGGHFPGGAQEGVVAPHETVPAGQEPAVSVHDNR